MLPIAPTRQLLTPTNLSVVVQSLSGLQSSVECVVFGEKEDTIAAGGTNGTVKVWDMDSGKGRCMLHTGAQRPAQSHSGTCQVTKGNTHRLARAGSACA